jgi:hypothetical protein
MIPLVINATNFTQLSKTLCIFVEISEQLLQFILVFFFTVGKKRLKNFFQQGLNNHEFNSYFFSNENCMF